MNIRPFFRASTAAAGLSGLVLAVFISKSDAVRADPAANDYPTVARVEYVNECIGANGGTLAALYQCSCAIDRIAAKMPYEQFVEAGTYARYATLPGDGGGIFRDSDEAKQEAKLYRELESQARKACGLSR